MTEWWKLRQHTRNAGLCQRISTSTSNATLPQLVELAYSEEIGPMSGYWCLGRQGVSKFCALTKMVVLAMARVKTRPNPASIESMETMGLNTTQNCLSGIYASKFNVKLRIVSRQGSLLMSKASLKTLSVLITILVYQVNGVVISYENIKLCFNIFIPFSQLSCWLGYIVSPTFICISVCMSTIQMRTMLWDNFVWHYAFVTVSTFGNWPNTFFGFKYNHSLRNHCRRGATVFHEDCSM